MGFGMCGSTVISIGREHQPQTPSAALAALPTTNPIRFFWQSGDGNGGAGSTVKGNICHEAVTTSTPQNATWFNALPTNAGAVRAARPQTYVPFNLLCCFGWLVLVSLSLLRDWSPFLFVHPHR